MDLTVRFVELCFAIFFVYWIVAAFFVKRTAEKQPRGQRILLLAIFAGAWLLLRRGGLIAESWNVVLWRRTLAVGLLVDAVVLAGLIVCVWARATLGGNWSASVTFKEGHELIELQAARASADSVCVLGRTSTSRLDRHTELRHMDQR